MLSDEYIERTFEQEWAKALYRKFGNYLKAHEVRVTTTRRTLSKVTPFFRAAEKTFAWPTLIGEEWIANHMKDLGSHFPCTFFREFLLQEQILSRSDRDNKAMEVLQKRIQQLPQQYRRLVEVVVQTRLAVRVRQIRLEAKSPLSLQTVLENVDLFARLIRWLGEHQPEVTGWNLVQEEHIQTFLLTFSPKSRELTRKVLYMCFCIARRKRIIVHVPLTDALTRELPQTSEPFKAEEQRALARLIRENMASFPEEAFLASLCFYQGLSSSQIRSLKLSQVDIEKGAIAMEDRPPIYLLKEDLKLLELFLKKRLTLPHAKSRSHLITNNQYTLADEPVTSEYVRRKVHKFTGYSPQQLRMACFMALSAQYGPQYLVETFGLSLTQSSRYGNLHDFLSEEETKSQREEFKKMAQ